MQIYIEYGADYDKYLSYPSSVVPRIDEEIQFIQTSKDGLEEIFLFKVLKVHHFTDGENYEVTLKCNKIEGEGEV